MTAVGEPSIDDLRAELDTLQGRIRQVRDERMQLTAATPSRGPLLAAAERARQDRDAQISPALTELREKLAERVAELHDRWHSVDRHRWLLRRIDRTSLASTLRLTYGRRAVLDAILADEATLRVEARDKLTPLGIPVPEVFAAGSAERD